MSSVGGPRIVYEASPEHMAGSDDVDVQDQQHGDEDEAAKLNAAPTLSKSWAVSSAHVPSYTGGKVVLCRGRGAKNLYGRKAVAASADGDDDAVMKDANDEGDQKSPGTAEVDDAEKPFLLAPCGGDLSLIDATRGVRARTLRTGCSTSHAATASIANYDEAAMADDDDDDDGATDRDALTAYALAPNDTDLIVCSRDSILRQYDLSGSASSYGGELGEGPAKVRRTIGRSGHDLPVTHIEFHCSGIFFATGSVDGSVKVWDLRGGYATHSFRPPAGGRGGASAVSRLAWQPDATHLILAIGREDGSICLHDLRSESSDVPIVRTTDHVSAVTCMVWAGKDRGLFLTAGRDAIINTWSIEEEVVDSASAGNQGSRKKKKRRKDGGSLAPTTTKTVYRRICTLPVYEQIEGMVVLPHYYHYHPDLVNTDIVIATAGSKGVVRVWRASMVDAKDGFEDSSRHPSVSDFQCVAEQDARSAFGEKRGGYMGLLRTSHRNRLRVSVSSHCPEELIAIDSEHNMSFLNLEGRTATCADAIVEGKAVLRMDRTIVGHNDEILDLRVIPSVSTRNGNGRDDADAPSSLQKVAVATNSAQIRIFELGTYSCNVLDGHTETVLSIDVSPCGRYLSSCGKDKTMRLWHVESGKCVAIATGHTEAIGASALSRKIGRYDVGGKAARNGGGAFALTASKDRTLKRWALPGASELDACAAAKNAEELSLRSLNSVRAHEKDINIVSVAPNDSLVATGSQDRTVKLWNSSDLSLRGTIRGHKRGVWDCQFSPFDRVLATCSGDRTVKLWSLSDLSCVRTFQGHAASTLRVRFLSGGLQLMSSGADGLVKLWTIRTNECEATMDGHNDKVWALDLHQDGTTFVSGGADSRIIVWNDTTKELEDAKRDEEEKNILMEQRLSNHLRFKEYEKALEIALELDKPRQALKVLTAIIENDIQKGQNSMSTLKEHFQSWPMSRTTQVLRYCRDWNTRARNSHVAMLTVKAIVCSIPAQTLAAADGIPELMAGIMPYAERHFQRLDKLYTSSYLIDYTLMSMGNMDDSIAEDYSTWEANQDKKLVLPPTQVDGKIQVGGTVAVGAIKKKQLQGEGSDNDDEKEEVITVGESESESESSSSDSDSDNDE